MALIEQEVLLARLSEDADILKQARELIRLIIAEAPTIDPIHEAGGCYCRECRFRGDPSECPLLYFNQRELDEHDTSDTDFCSYGEPREVQDDG